MWHFGSKKYIFGATRIFAVNVVQLQTETDAVMDINGL